MEREIGLGLFLSGLELYLVDDASNWEAEASRQMQEVPEGGVYTLNVVGEAGKPYKMFAVVDGSEEYKHIFEVLNQIGRVTGWGDVYPDGSGRIRLWFLLDGQPSTGSGVYANNLWGKDSVIRLNISSS